LQKEKVLVVGLGEVGRPLYEILVENGLFSVSALDIDEEKMREARAAPPEGKVDVMHICIPYHSRREFIEAALGYIRRFDPGITIINSTVPPGTTEELKRKAGCPVAHSPVRGVHRSLEHMKWELRRWTKYIGGADAESAGLASEHFRKLGLRVKALRSSRETELAKLFETTYRAWMITCFQEMHRISRRLNVDFDQVADFLEDTHRVRFDRPVMFPGFIGGHCLIPNVELLLETCESKFLRLILESNEERRREMEDEAVREEVERIKRRVDRLEGEMTKLWKLLTQEKTDQHAV